MNAALSKIHFVNTTGVSLNDRFTTMAKTVGFGMAPPMMEAPISRQNPVAMMDSSNRRLIDSWDRMHALHALTNNIIQSSRPARQRLQRNSLAQQMKRTMNRLPGGARRLQRSNSFTDIATMNADRVELLQRVRGRTPTISSRLGAADRNVNRGRSMSRGRSASRNRSTSRGRQPSLTRSNSQTNLQRAGSRTNLTRAGSRTNLTRAGSRTNLARAGSRNRLNATRKTIAPNDARRRINRNNLIANRLGTVNGAVGARGRSRSRSRVRGAAAAAAAASVPAGGAPNGRARSRSRKRGGSRTRAGSVNSRLGANRTNELAGTTGGRANGGRANGGRVTKRSRSIRRGAAVNASTVGARAGRPLKREAPKRKGAGGKATRGAVNSGGGANGSGAGAAASGRRGRSRSRRANSRVRGRSASKNRTGHVKQQTKSRAELDSELDQYMANTKSSLDKEMDQYMNGFGPGRI